MKRILGLTSLVCCLLFSTSTFAAKLYFNLTQSGPAISPFIKVNICLGSAHYNCQKYTFTNEKISITTNIPNHTYSHAVIQVKSPGATLQSFDGLSCDSIGRNCSFEISDKTSVVVPASSTGSTTFYLGGSVSGLPLSKSTPPEISGLVLQNNGADNEQVPLGSKSYLFNTRINDAKNYNVTLIQSPPGYSCSVSNGVGIVNANNVDNINVVCHEGELPSFSVSGTPMQLQAGNFPETKDMIVTNNSQFFAAANIRADFTGTLLEGHATQTPAAECANVLPGGTCTITFEAKTTAVVQTAFPIHGDNTKQAGADLELTLPTAAKISVSGSPLTLQATSGTPISKNITVTNLSIINASNIKAILTGTALEGKVSQDASDCENIDGYIPPETPHSCTLTFIPVVNSGAVATTSVGIKSDDNNIEEAVAQISVNGPPQAVIDINAGSPLELTAGGSAGLITIKNNSGTEVAHNINADFTSTALNGKVTQTASNCQSVNPGDSCSLSFEANTAQSQTVFPIQGDNTTEVNGEINIIPGAVGCELTASASGKDNDPTIASITNLSSCGPSNHMTLDAAISGSRCPSWYAYDLRVNGIEVASNQCSQTAFDLSPYFPITSVEIVSRDNDNWIFGDSVTLTLTLHRS